LSSLKRRWVKSGTNEFASTLYTIANDLGTLKGLYSRALNFKKPVTVFRVKKGGVVLAGIALPKIQKRVMTSRHSPCADTPPAATATVTTVDVVLLIF
jgi:hypothetical protein